MKLGVVSIYPEKNQRHSYKGGVAAYTKNLVESLVLHDKNLKVVVLTDAEDGKSTFYENNKKVKVIGTWKRGFGFFKSIIREVVKEDLKILHLHQEFRLYGEIFTSVIFLYLLFKLRKMGVKTIVTIHGVLSKNSINNEFVKENGIVLPAFLVRLAFGFVFNGIGRLADKVIVHEQLFKNFLVNDYGVKSEKVSVISLGVEDLKSKIDYKKARQLLGIKKRRVVLFFGYVTGYKSPDLLLEAFADYSKTDKDSLLIFAGGKHPKMANDIKYLKKYKQLEDLAKKIPQDQIWWQGFVKEEDIEKFIMAIDLLILPYKVAISASGPLALAFSYKKPFLISETLKGLFSNKEIVFKNNPQDLSLKMKEFFDQKIKINDFVKKEREKRLWKNIAKKTLSVYNALNS